VAVMGALFLLRSFGWFGPKLGPRRDV